MLFGDGCKRALGDQHGELLLVVSVFFYHYDLYDVYDVYDRYDLYDLHDLSDPYDLYDLSDPYYPL